MGMPCSTCTHAQSEAINLALLNQESFRSIERWSGLSLSTLHRHKKEHLGAPSHQTSCAACLHSQSQVIDDALLLIVAESGLTSASLGNHMSMHLTPQYLARRATQAIARLDAIRRWSDVVQGLEGA